MRERSRTRTRTDKLIVDKPGTPGRPRMLYDVTTIQMKCEQSFKNKIRKTAAMQGKGMTQYILEAVEQRILREEGL